jgi:hypothetical protein
MRATAVGEPPRPLLEAFRRNQEQHEVGDAVRLLARGKL